jgi:AraC family transcriptional regulator, positive regulator of tynA and feaB
MGFGSFCVGRERSVRDSARDFQAKFNETLETRFRLEPKDGGLVAKVTVYSSSRLRLALLRSSSHTMSLMPGQSASTDKKQFLVTFQAEGTSIVRQSHREASAVPGNLFVLDACKPFQVETSVVSLQSVYVPADVLREAVPAIDDCTAVVLPTRDGAGRIARVAFEELFDPASEVDEEGISRIAAMLPQTLAVAFGPHLKCRLSSSRDDHHRERIKDFVRRNLRNPRLNTSFIANGVGLSVRRLHELFVSEPKTLMRWTRAERLKRINDALADPALVQRPIANIAYDWGFREPSHFSRTFRTEYGVSPRVVRDKIRFTRPESSRIPLGRPWLDDRASQKAGETLTCGNLAIPRIRERAAQRCE